MTRYLRLFLLTMALLGLAGQSAALAMAPVSVAQPMKVSMAGMHCRDMVPVSMPDGSPCKKMTWQCIAAMGCATSAALQPAAILAGERLATRASHGRVIAAALIGLSYGPEPDPPSFLI
ncbi:MAG: hypothetical protein JWL96_3751 [Sphingomonas bacterium]|uniref:hypothetical protein n=1 Tax=Sphingomonas bacterium TaxID=1895847 RepID=UPI0026104793|nr:hypothetical protein [Sphingomonas bacterium]MDB5711681.1 hypothetical protein [Sphingomonas bacterium]